MGILAGKAKKEFSFRLGKVTALMKRRHEMFAELQGYPEAITDREQGAQEVLVDDEWFDFLFAKWNEWGDLATEEMAGIDGLFQLMTDEPRLMVPPDFVATLQQQRHQCAQALVITGATTSNMEAAKAGMTLGVFMELRSSSQNESAPFDAEAVWKHATSELSLAIGPMMDVAEGKAADYDSRALLEHLVGAQVSFHTLERLGFNPQWTEPLVESVTKVIDGLESHDSALVSDGWEQTKQVLAQIYG